MTKIKCEAGQFKKFIQAVRIMNSESLLHLDTDGISLRVVDTANVAMVNLSLKGIDMKGYKHREKCPQRVALEWSKISKVLNAAKAQTPLTLDFREGQLIISYDEVEGIIHHLDPNVVRKEPNPPTIDLKTSFAFDGSLINKMGRIILGDKLEITVKDRVAECRCEGEYGNKTGLILSRQSQHGDSRSLYSWDYVKEMGKVLDKAYVTAFFRDDHPLRLCAKIQGIDIEYLLAPRIES